MLVIRSLANSRVQLDHLSDSDDTKNLIKALEDPSSVKDVGHAGTAMRFLTALFSIRPGEVVLTGSARMKERPIGPLVEALRELGGEIEYLEREGCPPLRICGKPITGGSIHVEGGISSQFISALMMIGPLLKEGLSISLSGSVVSGSYIGMTVALMNQCGVAATFDGRQIVIPRQSYRVERFAVESDWSGASYWYQVAALLPGSKILLPNLTGNSLQGDAVVAGLFEELGVVSTFSREGVTLNSGSNPKPAHMEYDFTGCPDLVQTMAVTLCAMDVPFRFTGTRTLRIKETDRIAALEKELGKAGFQLESEPGGAWIAWEGIRCKCESDPVIQTYHDHRMAMAFAPLAIPMGHITIEDPLVVTKSYPGFWKELGRAGFRTNPVR